MSSDGSITSSGASRIRQFGLYRNIDARTEEFLRLSRKRQIRQGCACAAVSTAITVTVVVSVLLVYEYSINLETNQTKHNVIKPHWLGLINDSADVTPYDAKFPNNKLNIDKTTLKLLPIILKALNQNRFIEKVIEDHSSPSPTYERRDTTEFSLQKNVFSNERNLFKRPTQRLYAIEYKTSPILYYRNPTKNIEYFTKIRKIRDYQRILNYFDKMISEKVGYSATSPMMKDGSIQTEKPPQKLATAPINRHHDLKTIKHPIRNQKKKLKKSAKEDYCKCPIKLSQLLNKLITNINQIIPYMSKIPMSILCNDSMAQKLPIRYSSSTSPTVIHKAPTEIFSTHNPIETTTSPTFVNGNFKTSTKQYKYLENKDFNFSLNLNFIITKKPKIENSNISDYPITTLQKNVIDVTESKENLLTATKPMQTIKERIENIIYHTRKVYDSVKNTTWWDTTKRPHKKTFFSDEEYEDYFATTQNLKNDVDVPTLELIKSKMISDIKQVTNTGKSNHAKLPINKIQNDQIKDPINSSILKLKPMSTASNSKTNNSSFLPIFKYIKSTMRLEDNSSTQINKTLISIESKNHNESHNFEPILKINNIALDEDIDKVFPEEQFQDDEEIKQTDNIQSTFSKNDSGVIRQSIVESVKSYKEWKKSKNQDLVTPKTSKSMLPENRPVYLEIHRNDWRQDEHLDFDMNLNNNLFDLPTI